MPCGPRGIRGGWPRASAALRPLAHLHCSTLHEGPPRRAEGFGGLGSQGRAEVVPPALGPELALRPGELLEQGRAVAAELRLAPDAVSGLDHLPVTRFPGCPKRLDEVSTLGDSVL